MIVVMMEMMMWMMMVVQKIMVGRGDGIGWYNTGGSGIKEARL